MRRTLSLALVGVFSLAAAVAAATYSISGLASATQTVGVPFMVNWTASSGHPIGDTIALYLWPGSEAVQAKTLGAATNGTASFTCPTATQMGVNSWSIRILSEGMQAATTVGFQCVAPANTYTLQIPPESEFLIGDPISVVWTAPAGHSSTDKIVVAPLTASAGVYVDSFVTGGAASGNGTLRVNTNPGTYQVRYLNGTTIKTVSGTFQIVSPPNCP